MKYFLFVPLALLFVASCAPALLPVANWSTVTLTSTAGEVATYPRDADAAQFTVFMFFSRNCVCFSAHEARLRELVQRFSPLGVRFVVVDSETGTSMERDAAEVRQRNLPVPIFLDPGAKLATILGAQYATYSVVIDASGATRYRGGFDSDKSHLQADSTTYLANALADLTAGRQPRVAEAKSLGCTLQTW